MIKPIIGIGSDVHHKEGKRDRAFAYLTYVDSLRRAGAVPVIVPPQPENLGDLLDSLDGVLLAGGYDCDPQLFGEDPHPALEPMDSRRQSNDYELARLARERGVPTLGVCLGLQMMNVAAGGSLVQDIDTQVQTEVRHASDPERRVRHGVIVNRGTHLAGILPSVDLNVNSSHHQAVGRVGAGLRITAQALDEIIEGLEDPEHPFYLGVQWHPEDMEGEDSAAALFDAFVGAARRRAELRRQGTEMSLSIARAVAPGSE